MSNRQDYNVENLYNANKDGAIYELLEMENGHCYIFIPGEETAVAEYASLNEARKDFTIF